MAPWASQPPVPVRKQRTPWVVYFLTVSLVTVVPETRLAAWMWARVQSRYYGAGQELVEQVREPARERLRGGEARVWGCVPGKEPEAGTVARDGAAAAGESG